MPLLSFSRRNSRETRSAISTASFLSSSGPISTSRFEVELSLLGAESAADALAGVDAGADSPRELSSADCATAFMAGATSGNDVRPRPPLLSAVSVKRDTSTRDAAAAAEPVFTYP
jgi:hypothetical protein